MLDGCGGCEVGSLFKGCDEFGAAIGVAAVVCGIDADEYIEGTEYLGPGQCIA